MRTVVRPRHAAASAVFPGASSSSASSAVLLRRVRRGGPGGVSVVRRGGGAVTVHPAHASASARRNAQSLAFSPLARGAVAATPALAVRGVPRSPLLHHRDEFQKRLLLHPRGEPGGSAHVDLLEPGTPVRVGQAEGLARVHERTLGDVSLTSWGTPSPRTSIVDVFTSAHPPRLRCSSVAPHTLRSFRPPCPSRRGQSTSSTERRSENAPSSRTNQQEPVGEVGAVRRHVQMPPHRGLPDELPEPTRHRARPGSAWGSPRPHPPCSGRAGARRRASRRARRATASAPSRSERTRGARQRGGGLEPVETPEGARRGEWGGGRRLMSGRDDEVQVECAAARGSGRGVASRPWRGVRHLGPSGKSTRGSTRSGGVARVAPRDGTQEEPTSRSRWVLASLASVHSLRARRVEGTMVGFGIARRSRPGTPRARSDLQTQHARRGVRTRGSNRREGGAGSSRRTLSPEGDDDVRELRARRLRPLLQLPDLLRLGHVQPRGRARGVVRRAGPRARFPFLPAVLSAQPLAPALVLGVLLGR